MIQFTCPGCGGETFTTHGRIDTGDGPEIEQIRCVDCGKATATR